MTAEELDAFLRQKHVARLATIRNDGSPHLSPIWYVWDEGKIWIIFGATRLRVRNLTRDPRATICIDEDARLEHGFTAGAQGAYCRGSVELTRDAEISERVYRKFMEVYDLVDDPAYVVARDAEDRVIAILTPESWTTWDFTKS